MLDDEQDLQSPSGLQHLSLGSDQLERQVHWLVEVPQTTITTDVVWQAA